MFAFVDIGYTQGMNDLVSRFHVVLKSEYKTYYCFLNFMEQVEREFLEDGMISKLGINTDAECTNYQKSSTYSYKNKHIL